MEMLDQFGQWGLKEEIGLRVRDCIHVTPISFPDPQQGRSEGSGKMSSLKTKSHTSTHSRILKVVILRSLAGGEMLSPAFLFL